MPQQRGIVIEVRTDLAAGPADRGRRGKRNPRGAHQPDLQRGGCDAAAAGRLTLRTAAEPEDEQQHPEMQRARSVCLEVSDTGIGMDEETRRRCLEPFFTTKGERGTGLGLAMVYGVAQRHGADLEIDSAVGKARRCACASRRRPCGAVCSPLPHPPPRSAAPHPAGGRRSAAAQSLRDTLGGDGHRVTTPRRPGRHRRLPCGTNAGRPFAVVITDLGMPHVDGRKVASAVKAAAPATPVILLTGWGQRLVADGDIPPHVDRVLSKPPKLRELREALASLTDTAAAATNGRR